MKPGLTELLIILLVIVLLFGPGRIGKIAGELGNSIRSFRDGLKPKEESEEKKDSDSTKKNGDDSK